uniref:Peptidase A1 domain-containing protein n=1 Tax=Haemonchus contortus TaxID=6289 RepID=A0A7I4Z392_HAECO
MGIGYKRDRYEFSGWIPNSQEPDCDGCRSRGGLISAPLPDDIVLKHRTSSTNAGVVDNACGKIGLRSNLTKTMFMRNGLVPDTPFTLNGAKISECSMCI